MADKKKAMPKTVDGKSTKVGGGGRFAELKKSLEKKGNSAESATKIAASIGRAKYGSKMNQMAAAGRKRAKK